MYGFKEIELIQLKFDKKSATKIDAETWIGNPDSFHQLLEALRGLHTPHCLIFSGDVHYAFNRREVMRTRDSAGTIRVTQLTSSALCNHPGGIGRLGLKVLQNASAMQAFNRETSPYLRPREDSDHFVIGHANLGLLQLQSGTPVGYRLLCRKPGNNHAYDWSYDLEQPERVEFRVPK